MRAGSEKGSRREKSGMQSEGGRCSCRSGLFVYGMGLMETWSVLFGREEVVQPAMPCSSHSSSGQNSGSSSSNGSNNNNQDYPLEDGRVLEARGWWRERSGTDAQGEEKEKGVVPTQLT